MKKIELGHDNPWTEITHEKAQDIIYQCGVRRASVEIKRMMHLQHSNVIYKNLMVKMEAI